MRVLFRTDGGAAIGLGHLQRCLSLAEALRRRGADALFLLHGDEVAAERVREKGFGGEVSPANPATPDDVAASLDAAGRWGCSAVVVDSYLVDAAFLAALRDGGVFVVAIDDLHTGAFPNQMVVATGPHAPAAGYRSSSNDTRFLLGPAYTILRPEYWDAPMPMLKPVVRNVLVTSGGADPDGVLPSWLTALDAIDHDCSFTVVVGPFFTNVNAVHEAAAACSHTVRLVPSPPVMRPIQAAADLAVSAAGQTLYELCALGIPTIAVEIAANQRPQLDAFARQGALIEAAGPDQIRQAAQALIADPARRATLSETARRIVDRRGALSVADAILASTTA